MIRQVSEEHDGHGKKKLYSMPLYMQLEEDLKKRIESGEFKPGESIPSEPDLEKGYGVSRVTVREALSRLVAVGYLEKRRGQGTFVRPINKFSYDVGRTTSFTEEITARGQKPGTKIVNFDIEIPPRRIAEMLELTPGSEVVCLERLRYVDEEPILISKDYVPRQLAPKIMELGLRNESFHQELESLHGFELGDAFEEVDATLPTKLEAKMLGISDVSPVLKIHRVILGGESMGELANKPIVAVVSLFRGDKFNYKAKLTGRRKAGPT